MNLPDDLIDQIHYDICHNRIEGLEIFLTTEQLESTKDYFSLVDGRMLLGYTIRETTGDPNVVYPPKVPNEPWTVGGMDPSKGVSIL